MLVRRALLLLYFSVGLLGYAAERKPNILLIYSDDHGWADLGEQGVNDDIHTPNLDQLARDGIRCTRGYVSAPQCVPSRAGVLTGRYQQRFGLEDNNKGALPLTEVTLAERLKPAGYVTGQVGKWHLDLRANVMGAGEKDRSPLVEHMPHGQGFDEYWRGELGKYVASHDLLGHALADAPQTVEDRRFRVEVQTQAALSFLDRRAPNRDQPWFLYLAYFTPHVPLESPEPWFSRTPSSLPKERRQALAMIAAMDDGIGRIRAKLQTMAQDRDTLIFFIGDNGAPTHQGHWDGSINLPLIGEKGMLTDGGIRVPFVITWPGRLPAGQTYDKPVSSLDVAATSSALAALPADPRLDGVNLMPYLLGEDLTAPHHSLFWRWRSQAAVLEFPWKLIRLGPAEQFLFNVTKPEGEKLNVINEHAELAAQLGLKLERWTQQLSPPGLPTEGNAQDDQFFAEHVDERLLPAAKAKAPAPGSIQGWLCRGGRLSQQNGALVVKYLPDVATPPFLTISPLDFRGPAKLTVVTDGAMKGEGRITWRIRHEVDFDIGKQIPLQWGSAEQPGLSVASIPSKSRIIHLRLYLPAIGDTVRIKSIHLERQGQPPQVWDFTTVP